MSMEPVRKKKKRTSLVCLNCRRKKIKCDRGQPCDQCVKTGKASSCNYDEDALKANLNPHKRAPYMDSVNKPIRLNNSTPRSNGASSSPQSTQSSNSQEVITRNSAETELDLLKKRLQMIENSLKNKEQSTQGGSPSQYKGEQPPPPPPGYSTTQPQGYEKESPRVVFIDKSSHFFKPSTTQTAPFPPVNPLGSRPSYSSILNNPVDKTPKQPTLPPVLGARGSSSFLDFAKRTTPSARSSVSQGQIDPLADLHSTDPFSGWPRFEGLSPYIPALTPGTGFPANSNYMQTAGVPSTPKFNGVTGASPGPHADLDPKGGNKAPIGSPLTRNNGPTYPTAVSSTTNSSLEASELSSNTTPHDDNEKVRGSRLTPTKLLLGVNPYSNVEETINFYEGYSSVLVKAPSSRISFGPFTWTSSMQKDPALKILWDHAMETKESSAQTALIYTAEQITDEMTSVLTSKTNDSSINLDEKVFEKRLLQPEGVQDLVPYYELMKNKVEKKLEKVQNDASTLPLGLTYYDGKIEAELRLIDKIQLFLPKQKVIWKLICIFFTELYPFMPFVDEVSFREEIQKIIGPAAYEDVKISQIKIEKRLDLAFMGQLLIMLRLSYLSLFTNRNDVNVFRLYKGEDPDATHKAYKYLLSNPITINIIDIAQECLDQFNLFRHPSFPVLQLALFTKIYHTYAPEDGDGADGGDATGMLALLVQMATSLGCNREPEKLPNLANAGPLNNISRRIWHYLIMNDMHLCYNFGVPANIAKGSYDTKSPFYKEGEECLVNKEFDIYVNEALFCYGTVGASIRTILDMVLTIEGRSKISDVCNAVSGLEVLLSQKFGTLYDCLNPPPSKYRDVSRVFQIKFYLSVKSFCLSIFGYLFTHFESRDRQTAFFYLKKIILNSVGEVMIHYFDLIGNLKYDLFLNPTVEQTVHKFNHMLLAFMIRCNFCICHFKHGEDHIAKCESDTEYLKYFKTLCQVSSSLTRCLEVSIAVISKISNRYYYAWRISKGQTYFLRAVTKQEFYDKHKDKAKDIHVCHFTIKQLEEIINLCENTLSKLGKENTFMFSPEIFDSRSSDDVNLEFKESPGTTAPSAQATPAKTDIPKDVTDVEQLAFDGTTGGFDLDFVESEEIDKLWLQILMAKEKNEPDEKAKEATTNEPNEMLGKVPDMFNFSYN